MSESIDYTREIIPSAADKLIRKYPTIYGSGLDDAAIEGIRSGALQAEVVFYGDGTRGLRVREAAASKTKKSSKKIDPQPEPVIVEEERAPDTEEVEADSSSTES